MGGAPVLIPFISLLNSVLLADEPCYKFMLKYNIQNLPTIYKNFKWKINTQE